jgi:hypothetical protein
MTGSWYLPVPISTLAVPPKLAGSTSAKLLLATLKMPWDTRQQSRDGTNQCKTKLKLGRMISAVSMCQPTLQGGSQV